MSCFEVSSRQTTGAIRIMRPVINLQHVFHARYECGVGIRRDDPLLFQVRFKDVFFSVHPIVLSLARATMFSSTTLSSRRRNVHFARPLGGSEQASAVSLASAAPSKMRRLAEAGDRFGVSTASTPFFDQLLDELARRQSRGRCLAPQRSGCRSILPLPHRHRPSTRSAPWSTSAPGASLWISTMDALALPH